MVINFGSDLAIICIPSSIAVEFRNGLEIRKGRVNGLNIHLKEKFSVKCPVTPKIIKLEIVSFRTIRQKLAYPTNYLIMY